MPPHCHVTLPPCLLWQNALMQNRPTGIAPDYTLPALVSLGLNLFLWLAVIWAVAGFATALLIGALVNVFIPRRRR